MKTVVIALNSKYIHSSLAVWYLKNSCTEKCGRVEVLEYTINDSPEAILAHIYRAKADVAAFSCYIWNIWQVLRIAGNLKKVCPHIRIILGGPEVSYSSEEILRDNPFVDYIISGEGEKAFPALLMCLKDNPGEAELIKGLTYRKQKDVLANKAFLLVEDMDSIPSPYTDQMLSSLENRIVYMETSRGCPFSCSYCISSTFEGVRFFSMERVKKDLDRLVDSGVKQIKFVDRTFNCNIQRAKEVIGFIIESYGSKAVNFHFEAGADLFDEECLDILSKAPRGLIQLEIGIQTTKNRTLELINRKTKLNTLFENVKKLRAHDNIHLHLDLIAGLPGEDYQSFAASFNQVYSLKPHQLQLGFLKLLKGSKLRCESEIHGYSFREYPPYEVLFSKDLGFGDVIELKGIEDIVEKYFNSGRFVKTLEFMLGRYFDSPFEFYRRLYLFMEGTGLGEQKMSSRQLYSSMIDFSTDICSKEDLEIVKELMKLDYLSTDNSNNLPQGLERIVHTGLKEKCFDFLRDRDNIKRYLSEFDDLPAKQIVKRVHFEVFNYRIASDFKGGSIKRDTVTVLFNYNKRDKVSGIYEYVQLEAFQL